MLFHLEVGDAIAKQAAHPVVLFKQGDVMTSAGKLLGARHTGRARADNCYRFSGFFFGNLRVLSSLLPIHDRQSRIRWI